MSRKNGKAAMPANLPAARSLEVSSLSNSVHCLTVVDRDTKPVDAEVVHAEAPGQCLVPIAHDSHDLIVPDNFRSQALAFVGEVKRQLSKVSLQEAVKILATAEGLSDYARKLKATTEVINSLHYAKLLAIVQIMSLVPRKVGGRPRKGNKKPVNPLGMFSRQTLCFWRKIAEYKAWLQAYCQSIKKANADLPELDPGIEEISAAGFLRFADVAAQKAHFRKVAEKGTKPFDGLYNVVVVDPPWQESNVPYSTLSLEKIAAIKPPMADDCHVWLWTTHVFLPAAFEVLKAWGLEYVCTFDWVENRAQSLPKWSALQQ